MAIDLRLDEVGQEPARRGRPRRKLVLRTRGAPTVGDTADVTVLNISATGLLLQTSAKIGSGDMIDLELPEAPNARAKVVWKNEPLFGCEFETPVSQAALSAAELLSAPSRRDLASTSESPVQGGDPFGVRLRRLRKAQGITVAAFAKRLRVSRPTIWAWESGKSRPRRAKIASIMEALGMVDDNLLLQQSADSNTGGPAGAAEDTTMDLAELIRNAKIKIAELAGTSVDKVRVTIEI